MVSMSWPPKKASNPFSRWLISLILLITVISMVVGTRPVQAIDNDDLTVEYIAENLAARMQSVIDISANVSFTQVSPRNGSRSDGEIQIKAIFPNLVRAVWMSPDLLRGLLWIVDTQNDRFTQYEPTTGEARHHLLSDVVKDVPLLPLSPDQIFSLPSTEQFNLEIAEASLEGDDPFAVVRAVDKRSSSEYRVRVDLSDWMVLQIESISPTGTVELSAQVEKVHINMGLTATDIRALPPGTIERPMY